MRLPNISYWEKRHFYRADVIIVGSGIVGLSAAIAIKKERVDTHVIVLERGFLPSGASTKNAGFACFGSISELIEQEKICGTDGLHTLVKKRWLGLQKLRSLVGDPKLELQINGGFELFNKEDEPLAEECVSKIGHYNHLIKDITQETNAFATANEKLKSFGFGNIGCLISNKLEGQLDPGKMIRSLSEIAASLGVCILNCCEVIGFEERENEQVIFSNQGSFNAKKILFCTNAFANQLFPQLALKPGRGQVLITKPIENLNWKGTFHYNKGYYYFRNVGNRVLLGGGRNLDFFTEETHQFGETPLVQNSLLHLMRSVILPEKSFEIEQKWSGIMAFGPTLSPIIKEVSPNIFCAVRCNGMGIAIGSQTGQEAAALVLRSF